MTQPLTPRPPIPAAQEAAATPTAHTPPGPGPEAEVPTLALDRFAIRRLLAAFEEPATTPMLASSPDEEIALADLIATVPPVLPRHARKRRLQDVGKAPLGLQAPPAPHNRPAPKVLPSAVPTEPVDKHWRAHEPRHGGCSCACPTKTWSAAPTRARDGCRRIAHSSMPGGRPPRCPCCWALPLCSQAALTFGRYCTQRAATTRHLRHVSSSAPHRRHPRRPLHGPRQHATQPRSGMLCLRPRPQNEETPGDRLDG